MARYIVEKFADGTIAFNGNMENGFHGEIIINLHPGDTRQVDGVDYDTLDAWLAANPGVVIVDITNGVITGIPLDPNPFAPFVTADPES